eukprot:Gb_13501 [translate_table: standard]
MLYDTFMRPNRLLYGFMTCLRPNQPRKAKICIYYTV